MTSPSTGWVWFLIEGLSILIIGIGCGGEVWVELHRFSDKIITVPNSKRLGGKMTAAEVKERWKIIFAVVVVIGLAIEMPAFCLSFLASNKEILELKSKLQDRTITEVQSNLFMLSVKKYPKVPVRVFVGLEDYETLHYAQKIRQMLDAAGYNAKNNEGVVELLGSHVDVTAINDTNTSKSFGVFTFQYGTNTNVKFIFTPGSLGEIETNSSARFNVLNWAFKQIALAPGCAEDNRILKPGEFGVIVPQKNH
jgi:hypothetical protein